MFIIRSSVVLADYEKNRGDELYFLLTEHYAHLVISDRERASAESNPVFADER